MRGRAAAVALPVLVVVALVAVVAVASTGSTPGGTGATRTPSQSLYDVVFNFGLVAVVLGGLLLIFGLLQRKAIQREIATKKPPRTTLVSFLLGMGAFTALFYWGLMRWRPPETPAEDQELAFPRSPELPTLPDEAETSYTPTVSWIPLVVVVGLILVAVAAYVLSERRARRGRTPRDRTLAEELADVLDETLDDLRAEADPRRAIIAAYARLEQVLAASGIPRRPAETSDEYLARVLRLLELEPSAIRRLTRLFTRAKFSQHDVDLTMKEEAISALEDVRDDLRRSREQLVTGGDGALAGAAS